MGTGALPISCVKPSGGGRTAWEGECAAATGAAAAADDDAARAAMRAALAAQRKHMARAVTAVPDASDDMVQAVALAA